MAKLTKKTLALTFKFDCDRFLRFRLSDSGELNSLGVTENKYKRPGIELMQAAGRRWEIDKYEDLILSSPADSVLYSLEGKPDALLGKTSFKSINNLFDVLSQQSPPKAIIEAEFEVPSNITPGLQRAYDEFGLERVCVRPDILWIRPAGTGRPLIGDRDTQPEYEIHIIDVKMAAEPSLRHFTEVTYYALALAQALIQVGLNDRYAVSAIGMIWPGSHDANSFRNLVRHYQAKSSPDPVTDALNETLIDVPYEVYETHVRQFFEERLLKVLQTPLTDASWHVSPKCQLCEYVRYCREKASECDHLSRLAWLNFGQAELLRNNGVSTTNELIQAIEEQDTRWQTIVASSQILRAEGAALHTRAKSLLTNQPITIPGRRTAMMPRWCNQNIYITIHFDPGSGITFALGAKRVYFPSDSESKVIEHKHVFIVDRVEDMNPETERERLKEFANVVTAWMEEVSQANASGSQSPIKSHVYFWDNLEIRQFKRMLERHMEHPDVIEIIETLIRFFPPESLLPDPEAFKSQPGTAVKEVLRVLIGLPSPHDYSLFDVANNFHPNLKADGKPYQYELPYGFTTPMSDQIPFERAYELWQDKIMIRHFDPRFPNDMARWRYYSRNELYHGIEQATYAHLDALHHIVKELQRNNRECLIMKKGAFRSSPAPQMRVPEAARSLIAFEKLNVICQDIENRSLRALPVEEREARFFSIRGLVLKTQEEAAPIIHAIKENPQFVSAPLYVFDFSQNSRDSRIKEGDFTIVISNEESDFNLEEPWNKILDLDYYEAERTLQSRQLTDRWMINCTLAKLLQVQIIKLEPVKDIPYVVIMPQNQGLFQFAIESGLINLDSTLVLDTIFIDFSSEKVEKIMRAIGGKAAPIKRRQRRR